MKKKLILSMIVAALVLPVSAAARSVTTERIGGNTRYDSSDLSWNYCNK